MVTSNLQPNWLEVVGNLASEVRGQSHGTELLTCGI